MTKELYNKLSKNNKIILSTLKPNSSYTWKQEADDMIEEYNRRGVTTAPNSIIVTG